MNAVTELANLRPKVQDSKKGTKLQPGASVNGIVAECFRTRTSAGYMSPEGANDC